MLLGVSTNEFHSHTWADKYMLHDLAAACRKTKSKQLQRTINSPTEENEKSSS